MLEKERCHECQQLIENQRRKEKLLEAADSDQGMEETKLLYRQQLIDYQGREGEEASNCQELIVVEKGRKRS